MHFVIGGAYNGKANWVKQYYHLKDKRKNSYVWLSAYDHLPLPETLTHIDRPFIVLEGIEQWILQVKDVTDIDQSHHELNIVLHDWLRWAEQFEHQLVIIGTDISKGIVPIDEKERAWRDVTGFFYQNIVKKCTTFHQIWYGIATQLK